MSTIAVPAATSTYTPAADQAGYLREAAERIRARHSRVTAEMIDIGTELAAVKGRTDHGLFLGWLDHEVNMEPRLAQKYMRAAEWAKENAKLVSHLQPTAVMELASKSTPPTVIDAVAHRIDSGEKVTPTVVRRLLSEAREEKRRADEDERRSPAAKRAAAAKRAKERETRERLAAKHAEEEREHDAKAAGVRKVLAESLVAHLPDDVFEMLLSSLEMPWGERDLGIWGRRIFCGTFTYPMKDELIAARKKLMRPDGIMDQWVAEARDAPAVRSICDDAFVPPAHIRTGAFAP